MKYELKEAIVVRGRGISTTGPNSKINNGYPLGNQFQCRVLPEMNDIQETDLLPLFPNFFDSDQIAYQKGENVWVFCTEDFQAGFILGRMQAASGSNLNPFIHKINQAEKAAGLTASAYNDLTIISAAGSCIRFSNEITGSAGVIYSNTTVYLYGPKGEIWINNPGMKAYVSPSGEMLIEGKTLTQKFSQDVSMTTTGTSKEVVASKSLKTSGMVTLSAGGSRQDVTGSNKMDMTIGESNEIVGGMKSEFFSRGYSLTIGAGGLSIQNILGPISLYASGGVSVTSASTVNLAAPSVNITSPNTKFTGGVTLPVGPGGAPVLPGLTGFCMISNCLFNGAPHATSSIIGV